MPSTSLMILVSLGLKDDVKTLVDSKKYDLEETDGAGARAVHVAASCNNFDILKVLVDGGAKLNVKDGFNQTPLSLAEENKNQDMINFIKEKVEAETSKSSGLTK